MDGSSAAVAGFKGALLALICAGCTSIATGPQTLEGSEWQVTAINGSATPRAENFRVSFRDGRIGGRFGCNNFGGTYRLHSGSTLAVGPVAATRMACEGPGMEFESAGFAVLVGPVRISWTSARQLTLSNAAGSIALERLP